MVVTVTEYTIEGKMRAYQAKEKLGDEDSSSDLNVIVTNDLRVACNGGGGSLGHPQVWLNIGTDSKVICPYCSREFVKSTD